MTGSPLFAQASAPDSSPEGFRPLVSDLVKDVLRDQRDIWTSPFHIDRENALPWIIVPAVTAGLIAGDHRLSQAIPFAGSSNTVGTDLSRAGQWYSVLPAAGLFWGAGYFMHDPKLEETGVSGLEAVLDASIVTEVTKVVARRQRPRDGDHGGHFEKGGSSFPSGHSTEAWAIASVVASEYSDHRWVPVAAYTYAAGVSVARLLAQEHFSSDVFVGGAIGFFVGRYVVRTHRGYAELRRARRFTSWMPSVQPDFGPGEKNVELAWAF